MNETLREHDKGQKNRFEPARLIVWECDGSWARHLRRQLPPDGPRVYEVRTVEACCEMVVESPVSMVVALWKPATAVQLIAMLSRFRDQFPGVRLVAVAGRTIAPFRWQILEAGAVWLCTSPRELEPVVGIVERHFAGVAEPSRTPEERIWDELPWPR